MVSSVVHIGCGAGFSGDRVDAAIPVVATLAKKEGPKYLIFETLAERTLALAQKHRRKDPSHGYSPFLESYIRPILKKCHESGIKIVSNFGAANPKGGAIKIAEIAKILRIIIIYKFRFKCTILFVHVWFMELFLSKYNKLIKK